MSDSRLHMGHGYTSILPLRHTMKMLLYCRLDAVHYFSEALSSKGTNTCFALACSIQVVVGAQQLALAVGAAVVDTWRQVGAKVDLRCHIAAHLKPAETNGRKG